MIMLANRPLGDLPELRALASRIAVHRLEISNAEMLAHMRRIATRGWKRYRHQLDAEKCMVVCEQVIAECRRTNCPLDLRLLDNAYLDYLQWDSSNADIHWHDLVASRVQQAATHFRHEISMLSREERKSKERELVRQIAKEANSPADAERLWEQKTGKKKSTYYSRKREVESGEFDV
jgi:hypothetical protein